MTTAPSTIRNFEEASLDDLIAALTEADDFYHNTGEPIVEDSEYDIAKRYAETLNPAHVYFTGIGSDVRGGKVKLPYQMGSLDQVYEGEITKWIESNGLGDALFLITDKLDGTSALIIYGDDGELQIAYSRGNGIEGADITRHIRKIPSVPQQVSGPMVVRAEVIIPIASFEKAKATQKSRSGGLYKNPRNMVAGIMNAKTNSDHVYEHMHVVAYEHIGNQLSKESQLETLEQEGFIIPRYIVWDQDKMNDDDLTVYLHTRRKHSAYEIDGIVIDVNSTGHRNRLNPTRDTLNPAYAVKYKIASADNVKNVRVVEVEWNVSKHGYMKPRVRVEPVELMGVTIQHATGFNAKFIKDNQIGAGAIIRITRSGDVIPFIIDVLEPGQLVLPEGEWTETGVDLITTSKETSDEVHFKQVADFFASIDAPHLKDGSVAKMFEKGFTTVADIINAEELDFIVALGKNGTKVFEGLRARLTDIHLYTLVGAFSKERGIGERKIKKLQRAFGRDGLYPNAPAVSDIAAVEGFDTKTAERARKVLIDFVDFFADVSDVVTIAEDVQASGSLSGQKVVFTGFRDKDLAAQLEALGGEVASGVSKKVTMVVAANPNSNSGKVKKANQYGIRVIGLDEFKEML